MSTNYPYIAIEGVIGVGKTTLGRLLRPRFQAELFLEAFDKNPFLSNFYQDRTRYAFQTQIFFLLSRFRQQQTIPTLLDNHAVLADYFFAKDYLFAHLNIDGDELTMYEQLYETLTARITPPQLVVYLRATTDTLMSRITMRDRTYEREMDRNYIAALRQAYENIFASYTETPLLVIETDEIDFVRRPDDLEELEQRIRASLAGIRQPALPELAATPVPRDWNPPQLSRETPEVPTDRQTLGDFLALTQSVGAIGGALAKYPPSDPADNFAELRRAVQTANGALQTLAQRTGIELSANNTNSGIPM
ncbi:MAG: deoxynucleoside kinase [Chloroflexota bacterium]|nr:deoxynucleoside kinase [Chloroflexota bacterium]